MLAECDEDLSRIASDVTALSSELSELRAGGHEVARLLSERDRLVDSQREAIAKLYEERSRLSEQAEAAATATRANETLLGERDAHVAALQSELDALRAGIDARERRLADAEAELSSAQDALADSERALEDQRTAAASSGPELTAWQRRSAHLLLELADIAVDHERLEASLERLQSAQVGGIMTGAPVADDVTSGHLRLIAVPDGYRLVVSEAVCPLPGDHLEVEGRQFVVTRTGPSPLPRDERRCAMLVPAHG